MQTGWMPLRLVLALVMILFAWPAFAQTADSETAPEPPAPVTIEQYDVVYRFEEDGKGIVEVHSRARIATEEGRQQYGQFYLAFRSEIESVEILALNTIKPDGDVIPADLSNAQEISAPVQSPMPVFTDVKYKMIPVSALQVGDTVESSYRRTLHTPLEPGAFWMTHYLLEQFPVERQTVLLDLPAGRETAFAAHEDHSYEDTTADGRRRRTWRIEPVEASAAMTPSTRLFAVSTFTTWDELGTWMRRLFAASQRAEAEVSKLARELTAEPAISRATVDAAYAHVANSIRYVSLSLGLGGYQPRSPADVLRSEYGDCKDKHLLLASVLKEIQIPAYPALVHTTTSVESDVPTPVAFDHVITAVELDGELYWLDSTLETTPPGVLNPALLGEKALLIRPDESSLIDLPQTSPVPNYQRSRMTGSLDSLGALDSTVEIESRGLPEVPLRQVFRQTDDEEQRGQFALMTLPYDFWSAEIEELAVGEPLGFAEPYAVSFDMQLAGFVDTAQRSERVIPALSISLPWPGLNQEQAEAGEKQEQENNGPGEPAKPDPAGKDAPKQAPEDDEEPIQLGGPYELTDRVEIAGNDAFEIHPPGSVRDARDFATYEASYSVENGKLIATRVLRVLLREAPPSRRDELEAFNRLVEQDLERTASFTRTGEVDLSDAVEQLDADALDAAAHVELQRGNPAKAITLLLEATRKEPDHLMAWNNLGRAYLETDNTAKALEAFEQQLERSPQDRFALNNLGRVHLRRRDFERAVVLFQEQVEIDPGDTWVLENLAFTLDRLERWNESAEIYRRLVDASPSAMRFAALGGALLHSGHTAEAHQYFERALDAGGHVDVLNEIAYMSAEAGRDLEQAKAYARDALARPELEMRLFQSLRGWPQVYVAQSTLSAYLDTYGWVQFKSGELEGARAALTAALSLRDHYEIARHLAELEAAAGNMDQALERYAEAHFYDSEARLDPPAALSDAIDDRFPDPSLFEDWLTARRSALSLATTLPKEIFRWPGETEIEETVVLPLILRVGKDGTVLEARAMTDEASPFAERARVDALGLRFPPVRWDGRQLNAIRIVAVTYSPTGEIEARRLPRREAKEHVRNGMLRLGAGDLLPQVE